MNDLIEKDFHAALQAMDPNKALTLPAFMYLSKNVFNKEQASILKNSWQYVGHSTQLAKPGDHLVTEIFKVPVIVLKNKQHEINAFVNVCRHRGGPLAYENGHSKMLVCKYHGWTYDLEGKLVAAPEMQSTPNFDICTVHLPKVKLQIWQEMIFVNVGHSELSPLDELLADIAENITPIDLSTMQFSHRDTYPLKCNWKVYMDNYLEGYHLPMVHPELNKLLDYRSYQTTLHPWYSYQFSPLEVVDNPSNFYGEGKAHYYCIFPNMMLNILPGRLQANRVVPVGLNETIVYFDYFYSDLDSDATKALIEQDLKLSETIQQEDIQICEVVQKGLQSGTYDQGQFCIKREHGVLHFQELVRKLLRQHENI